MDRLTEKPFRIDSEYCYEQALVESDCKFYRFVSEVEDFLEEQGFENLEDLKKCFEIWNSEDDEAFSKDNDNMKLRVYRFAKNQLHFHLRLTKLLSYRWQKLKEYVEQFKEYDPIEADLAWKIAEKMKELEGEKDAES